MPVSRRHQLVFVFSGVVSLICHVLAVSRRERKSDRLIEVPELTAEEIQARVLHRDGLMLVIDKPAGLPVHRGPKGGANLESSFDALRFGLPRRAKLRPFASARGSRDCVNPRPAAVRCAH